MTFRCCTLLNISFVFPGFLLWIHAMDDMRVNGLHWVSGACAEAGILVIVLEQAYESLVVDACSWSTVEIGLRQEMSRLFASVAHHSLK